MAKKKTVKRTLSKRLAEIEAEVDAEESAMWGTVQQQQAPRDSLLNSSKFREIIAILSGLPLLVQPTLNWLRSKQAEMSMAQLRALYTDEQINAMYKEMNDG